MCVCATAKRRRRQAVGGYKHLPPKRRPNYSQRTAAVFDKRAAKVEEKRRAMQGRKRKR